MVIFRTQSQLYAVVVPDTLTSFKLLFSFVDLADANRAKGVHSCVT
jgi:hypothetical protein